MFDQFKGMAGLAGMMKDLPKLKAKMEEVRERLGQVTVESETGGGAVRVRANAQMQIENIDIDHAILSGLVDSENADDRTMAEDLITGAVNAALKKAREAAEQEMADAASEMGLPLPPGGISGLMQ